MSTERPRLPFIARNIRRFSVFIILAWLAAILIATLASVGGNWAAAIPALERVGEEHSVSLMPQDAPSVQAMRRIGKDFKESDSLNTLPMCVMACTDGASWGISDTECSSPTRSNDGIADAQFQPTDARVVIRITASQARMMNTENLRMLRAMKGGRGCSVLMQPSLVPQQQGTD